MARLTRRRFMQASGAAAAGAAISPMLQGVTGAASTRGGSAPNIIFIVTDDMRFDEAWVMRKTVARMFNQATAFNGFMTSRPVCQPSRASFITGQYVQNNKVINNNNNWGDAVLHDTNQLPVWLKNAGYYTACLGKYLNSFTTADAVPPGWNDFEGHCSGGIGPANYVAWTINNNGVLESGKGYIEDENLRRAQQMVARWRANSSQPLFMYMGNTANHAGTHMVAPRYAKTMSTWKPSWRPSFNEADVSDKPKAIQKLGLFDSTKITAITNAERIRLGALLGADDAIDALLTAMGPDLANTIVIFTSDNGFMNGEHRIGGGKSVVYEESARVPLYIMGAGFPAGVALDSVCSGVDIAPTICALAGATPTRIQDGQSILAYTANPALGLDRCVLVDDAGYRCVRTTYWKYVLYTDKEEELYHLKTDPYELNSLHKDPASQAVKQVLIGALAKFVKAQGAQCAITVAPVPAFTTTTNGMTVDFDGSASFDLDSSLRYDWNFGDGNTVIDGGPTQSHQYATRGNYTAYLTVTNARGAGVFTGHTVTVDIAPVAAFTWTTNGDTVTFDASSSTDPDGGSVAKYAWDFGDGTTDTTSGVSPQHTYAADGTYTVTLTVTDDGNLQNSVSHSVAVAAAPIAAFTWSADPVTADVVNFDASGSSDPGGGTITSYAWDFGDGNTDTTSGVAPQHTYASDGTYTVTLTVTDDASLQGTTQQQVTASTPAPPGP